MAGHDDADRVLRELLEREPGFLQARARRADLLAYKERFEEAALTRDRARAFAAAIERQRSIDALRAAKIAKDRGIGGPILSASSYFMKSPPVQYFDDEAHEMVEQFADHGADNPVWPN